jgi:two-component system, cell cycle sensor histidine kinase and response regulator CckA
MITTSEHQRLLEKIRHLEEREAFHRRTLADILAFSTRLTKTTDLSSLYRQSNRLALNILNLDYSTLMLLNEDGNSLVIRDAIGFPAAMIGTFALVEGQGLSTYVVKEKQAAIVEDFHTEKRFEVPPVIFREGIISAVSVPMLLGEQVFGVMIGHTRSRRRFSAEEIDLYQSLANQAAVAIKNVIHFESLLDSEKRFRTLIDFAADAIYLADTNGRLVDVNEQACLSLGYGRDELLAMTVGDIDPDAREKDDMGNLWQVLTPGQPVTITNRHRRKNGTVFPVEIRVVRIPLHGDNYILGFARDVSERQRAAMEQQKLQEQLAQAQKMESVGRLAGGVAHDFNNMLSVILGYAEILMADSRLDNAIRVKVGEIRSAAQRSVDLTRQLLGFARRQTVTPKILSLNDTVSSMHSMLRRLIGENIELSWVPGVDLWPLNIDPAQVDQILANLCVNASDAIGGVGRILIETKNVVIEQDYCDQHTGYLPGEYVKLMVSDNGCGIESESLSLIFEPFFTTKSQGKGTGLGLATVYGIVRQNNGFINVYSEPGTGTTFTVYLPPYAGKGGRLALAPDPVEICKGFETILLVEDEPAVLDLTRRLLEKLGYRVLPAVSPSEAIRLAEEHGEEISLLMTDVIMPEMNGRELSRRLLSLNPKIGRLFMSGYTANIIAHHGVLEGGINFIQKPFTLGDLAAKLQEVLG